MFEAIEDALRTCREGDQAAGTSDLHVEANQPPWRRVDGTMQRMDLPPVEAEAVRAFCEAYLSRSECDRLAGAFGSADGAIQHPNLGAIRIHAFRAENGLALSLRLLRDGVPDLASLGLPPIVSRFADFANGLVLFTGPTGSGKSTALAALVDDIISTSQTHAVVFEDPGEYAFSWQRGILTAYEVGRDVASFAEGIRGALRADPDVIVIGELRGLDTMSAALQAAETGHVVFAALHAPCESGQAITRIVSLFPAGEQEAARHRLSDALRAIISLRLLPLRDGSGLRAAAEIVNVNDAVRRLIRDGMTHQLRSYVIANRRDGSQTLESHLSELVAAGEVDLAAARSAALFPDDVRRDGRTR